MVFALTRTVYWVSPEYSGWSVFDQQDRAGIGNRQTAGRQGRMERAISRTGTTSDRDVLAASELEQRWGDWDVPSFDRTTVGLDEPLELKGSCHLVVCFVFASWPGGIAGDTPTQGWRLPSPNRAESGSRYVLGSTSSCGVTAEVIQWRASTTKSGVSARTTPNG